MGAIREVLSYRSLFFSHYGVSRYFRSMIMVFGIFIILFALVGCKTTSKYRMEADRVAETIIEKTQEQLLHETGDFSIERPSDILRRRLLIEQELPYYGEASLGSDALEPVPHWPEKDYPKFGASSETVVSMESAQPFQLSLIQALQVAAQK